MISLWELYIAMATRVQIQSAHFTKICHHEATYEILTKLAKLNGPALEIYLIENVNGQTKNDDNNEKLWHPGHKILVYQQEDLKVL